MDKRGVDTGRRWMLLRRRAALAKFRIESWIEEARGELWLYIHACDEARYRGLTRLGLV